MSLCQQKDKNTFLVLKSCYWDNRIGSPLDIDKERDGETASDRDSQRGVQSGTCPEIARKRYCAYLGNVECLHTSNTHSIFCEWLI